MSDTFSTKFKAVAALLTGASNVAITGGAETIEISADELQKNIEADTKVAVDQAVAAAQGAGSDGRAAESKRWDDVMANETCRKHFAATRGYLAKTEMSADDIIAQVSEIEKEQAGSPHNAAAAAAADRLAAASGDNANPDTGVGGQKPKETDEARTARKEARAEKAKKTNAKLGDIAVMANA